MQPFLGSPPLRYYLAIVGGDFAGVRERGGKISIDWYECPRGAVYSLHTDKDRIHVVLKEDGRPMLAWSKLRGR
jgi:hypothetical protein